MNIVDIANEHYSQYLEELEQKKQQSQLKDKEHEAKEIDMFKDDLLEALTQEVQNKLGVNFVLKDSEVIAKFNYHGCDFSICYWGDGWKIQSTRANIDTTANDKSLFNTLMVQLGKINKTMRIYKIHSNVTVEVMAPNEKAAYVIAIEAITTAGFTANKDKCHAKRNS